MQEITSVNNETIKQATKLQKRKFRNETSLFMLEGFKCLEEAIKYGIHIQSVFVKSGSRTDIKSIEKEIITLASEHVMKKLSTTESAPEVIAIAKQHRYRFEDLFTDKNPFILVLDGVKDPGNLGTIIRTAVACGVSGVILTDSSVDIFNPKIIRSTVGNLWKLPIITCSKESLKANINKFQNCQFIATVVNDDKEVKNFFDIDYTKPTVLVLGSEAQGISEELLKQVDIFTSIPMDKTVESLNLSVSAGVLMYEFVRQKLLKKSK